MTKHSMAGLKLTHKRNEAKSIIDKLPLNQKYGATVMMDLTSLDLSEIAPSAARMTITAPASVNITKVKITEKPSSKNTHDHYAFTLFDFRKDKLTALHTALCTEINVIHVPRDTILGEPVVISADTDNDALAHTAIIIDENSSADVHYSIKSNSFLSSVIEIFVNKNAHLRITDIQRATANTTNTHHFNTKIARLEQDSSIEWLDIIAGSGFNRSETTSILAGQGSKSSAHTLFIGSSSAQLDIAATALHKASRTESKLSARGILKDNAKNIYRGLIDITKDANNSCGSQREDVLLLDPTAEADSIPKLVIDNNDVRCSHAASVGHIDEEKLFYLTSRGLSEQSARNIMVRGFAAPAIDTLADPHAKQAITCLIEAEL